MSGGERDRDQTYINVDVLIANILESIIGKVICHFHEKFLTTGEIQLTRITVTATVMVTVYFLSHPN